VSREPVGTILFGGSGFLGPYILQRDPSIVSVGRRRPQVPARHVHVPDLKDLRALDDLEFDTVIFIVGNTDHHALERETLPPGEPTAFDYHLAPLVAVLEQIKARAIRKSIAFSTVLIYDPARITLPVTERSPIAPYRNRYVLSKYLAEEACRFYARWLPILTVRMSNLYGPTPLERYDFIHVVSRALLRDGRAEIWSRRPARDFIHADDAARAVLDLAKSDVTGIVNLGTGTMTRVGTVADILERVSGRPIVDRDVPVDGPMEFRCDTTLLEQHIGWRARWSIDDGVRDTFEKMRAYTAASR
jgi:nucleoside-diphosphate-sugar epimerase